MIGLGANLKVVNRKKVYEGFLDFLEETIEHPNGDQFTINTLRTKANSVAILPELPDGRFLLAYEFRFPIQQKVLSPPGGRLDENEDPVVAAKRELLEETGYSSDNWTLLGSVYPYPAISDQMVYLVHARDVKKTHDASLDPLEQIETTILSHKEVHNLIQKSSLVDGILPNLLLHLRA